MERNDSRMTWVIIIGLIVIGSLASAVWPAISAQLSGRSVTAAREAPEPIVIDIEKYLLGPEILDLVSDYAPEGVQDFVNNDLNGREVPQAVAIGILVAVTVGSLVIFGAPIALIYTRLEKAAASVQEDEGYKAAVTVLDQRQKAEIKEAQQAKPARITGDPDGDRRGFAYTMAFLGIIFAWVVGTVIGYAAYGGEMLETSDGQLINPVSVVSLVVLVVTLAAFFIYFRFIHKPEEMNTGETDNSPVSWGWVWVIVSGLLIVGLGTGFALNLIASGSAPPG